MRGAVHISLMAVLLIVASAGTPARTARIELDLDGSPARCRDMARRLVSSDVAEWREAQFRLAGAGPAALAAIDLPGLLGDVEGRVRVRGVVEMALVRSVTVRNVQAHARLYALVADSIAKGLGNATRLEQQREFEGPDADAMIIPDDKPRPTTDKQKLHALGGCAIPAALSLLHSPNPIGRAYGVWVIRGLGATPCADSVAALVNDTARFPVDHGDFTDAETVGANAGACVAALTAAPRYRSDVYEESALRVDDTGDLINGIRQTSQAMQANNWEQWWNEARPVWRDWWRLAGDGLYPPDREEWLHAVSEYRGFRLLRVPNPEPRTVLRVTGPPGTRCRVETDSMVVAEGEPPLEVVREQDSVSVARRKDREMRGDYSDRTFDVIASLPGGRSFRRGFFWAPSMRLTVELLPALKPHRP